MVEIGQHIDRPPASLVESFANVPTAVISDVTERETVMDSGMKPVSTATAAVGTAVPVRAPPGDNLTVHKALTLATAGDILVVDAGGYTEAAIWGELLSTSALAHGLNGTVVDGAVRDVEDLGDLGYTTAARAVCPKSPEKKAAGSIHVPVTCGGIRVCPGDIVVVDREGVAVVDPERARQVHDDATAKLDREADLKARAEDGDYLYDILGLAERFDRHDVREVPADGSEPDDGGE